MAQSTWLRVASVNGPLSVEPLLQGLADNTEGAFKLLQVIRMYVKACKGNLE